MHIKSGSSAVLKNYPNWFYLPAAVVFIMFFIVPTAMSFLLQFHPAGRFLMLPLSDFENYITFMSDLSLKSGLVNTIIYAVVTSGLKTVISLLLAVLLTSRIRFKGFLRSITFFPVIVSTVAVGITFSLLMQPSTGLINTVLGTLGLPGPDWLGNPSLAFVLYCTC